MINALKNILGRSSDSPSAQSPRQIPIPTPASAICIVGDLHGRRDLLDLMLAQIASRTADQRARPCVVMVGDMIDRGPDSAATLRHLHELNTQDPEAFICLMGNHERMMLDFIDDPLRHGPRWIAAGGAETLSSFGLLSWGRTPMPQLAVQLRAALTPPLENWVRTLPLYWKKDTVAATHAGAAAEYSLEMQPAARLLWGARTRSEGPRTDGICIVQGHDIVAHAGPQDGRIMVDTGAWRSGKLSAAWLDAAGLSILEVALPAGF